MCARYGNPKIGFQRLFTISGNGDNQLQQDRQFNRSCPCIQGFYCNSMRKLPTYSVQTAHRNSHVIHSQRYPTCLSIMVVCRQQSVTCGHYGICLQAFQQYPLRTDNFILLIPTSGMSMAHAKSIHARPYLAVPRIKSESPVSQQPWRLL